MTHPFARAGRELVPGHWFGPAAVLALGCATAWALIGFGHGAPLAAAVLVGSLLLALWNSPLRASGHEPLQAVRSVAAAGRAVVVLWRPGCPYSSALRRRAAREGLEVHWVNIWRDEDAYRLCCGINGGSEETPTAMLLDPALASPVVIPASVPGIREATAAPLRAIRSVRAITSVSDRPRSLGVRGR
ncbi:hypothetical protein [Dietzia sp. B32]|uniref:hypothetical protein n=1 Tax=Dietzia sp. B32 TaxID=2915130 RepID=UPI0021AD7978|nr:hypothetical protein [Dietzia sp. B32]UVE94248.1 hypothetical protein L8M95_11885 [Dietzia sp. B32]